MTGPATESIQNHLLQFYNISGINITLINVSSQSVIINHHLFFLTIMLRKVQL